MQALGGAEVPSENLERMVLHADTSAAQDAACKVLISQCSGRAARAATLAAATKLMKRAQPGPKAAWVCRLLRKHLGCSNATVVFKEAPPRTLHSTCGGSNFDCPDLRETFMLHLQRCADGTQANMSGVWAWLVSSAWPGQKTSMWSRCWHMTYVIGTAMCGPLRHLDWR